MTQDNWCCYRRYGEVERLDLKCICGATVYLDRLEFSDGCFVNRIFCTNCGLQMRSPGNDINAVWLKDNWKEVLKNEYND